MSETSCACNDRGECNWCFQEAMKAVEVWERRDLLEAAAKTINMAMKTSLDAVMDYERALKQSGDK